MKFNNIPNAVVDGEVIEDYVNNNNTTQGEIISIRFLNKHFGHLETAKEMKKATESERLKLYFDWLKEKGILN